MVLEEAKLLIEDTPYQTPLADTRNIQPRLVHLSMLLEQICELLVESTSAARARGIVETAIRLQLINFDVMELALSQVKEVLLCNTYPTAKETPCHELVKEAFDLSTDILSDLPLGLGMGSSAPSSEEIAARIAELKANIAASQKAEEENILLFDKAFDEYNDDTLRLPAWDEEDSND